MSDAQDHFVLKKKVEKKVRKIDIEFRKYKKTEKYKLKISI